MDRNRWGDYNTGQHGGSLSVRRAWIEIPMSGPCVCCGPVALRKESVDRNLLLISNFWVSLASLSVRRAWREISTGPSLASFDNVALRKESVDRNNTCPGSWISAPVALRKESVDRNRQEPATVQRLMRRSP